MPENMLSSTKKNLLIYWKDKYVKHIDSLEEKERNFARIFISKDVFVLCVPVCPWQGDMGPGGQDERTVLGLKATDTFIHTKLSNTSVQGVRSYRRWARHPVAGWES